MSTEYRKPWGAALLSVLCPGLGHIYLGQAARGVKLYCLLLLAMLPVPPLFLWIPLFPANIILPIIGILCAYAYVACDAVRCARRQQGPPPPRKAYNKWYVYPLLLLASGVIGELVERPALRTMAQAFTISSGSMLPTLQIGDHILVDKLRYHFRPIARGDVIVYKYPQDESRSFLHRVVGLPGETLEIRGTQVLINGTPLAEPYAAYGDWPITRLGERKGFGPVVIPTGKLFILGDNRDHAMDSRVWGFLDLTNVMGKVAKIYFSYDSVSGTIRWARMGIIVL